MFNTPGWSRRDYADWYSLLGCWNSDIAVPCKASVAVVELGLWSMLPMAVVECKSSRRFGGHTTWSR